MRNYMQEKKGILFITICLLTLLLFIGFSFTLGDANHAVYRVQWGTRSGVGFFLGDEGLFLVPEASTSGYLNGQILLTRNNSLSSRMIESSANLKISLVSVDTITQEILYYIPGNSEFLTQGQPLTIVGVEEEYQVDLVNFNRNSNAYSFPHFTMSINAASASSGWAILDSDGFVVGMVLKNNQEVVGIPIDYILSEFNLDEEGKWPETNRQGSNRPWPSYHYNHNQEITINEAAIFGNIADIEVDRYSNFYTVDSLFGEIKKFSSAGSLIHSIDNHQSAIVKPMDIAISSEDIIYCLDTGKEAIVLLNINLEYLDEIAFEQLDNYEFLNPIGIISIPGGIWLLTSDNKLVHIDDNRNIDVLAGTGYHTNELRDASEIAPTPYGFAVLDNGNSRIQFYNLEGEYLSSIPLENPNHYTISTRSQYMLLANTMNGQLMKISLLPSQNFMRIPYAPTNIRHQCGTLKDAVLINNEHMILSYQKHPFLVVMNNQGETLYQISNYFMEERITQYPPPDNFEAEGTLTEVSAEELNNETNLQTENSQLSRLQDLGTATVEVNEIVLCGINSISVFEKLGLILDEQGHLLSFNLTNGEIQNQKIQTNYGVYPTLLNLIDENNVIAVDQNRKKIMLLEKINNDLWMIHKIGSSGRGSSYGEILLPMDILLYQNQYYITDSENNTITVWDDQLTLNHVIELESFFSPNEISQHPYQLSMNSQNNLLVLTQNRILEINLTDDSLVQSINLIQLDQQRKVPRLFGDIVCLKNAGDLILISDSYNHQLLVFNSNGILIGTIGRLGNKAGEFYFPNDLIPLKDGTILVNDKGNNRLQRLSIQR